MRNEQDTVWPVDRGVSWDEADSGWQELYRFINYHRKWLNFLPEKIATDIQWNNALRFFKLSNNANKQRDKYDIVP